MSETPLTQEQLADYERDGCLVLRNAVGAATRQRVAACFEEIVDAFAREMVAAGDLADLHEDLPFETRWAAIRAEVPATRPMVWRRVLVRPEIHDLWLEPALLGAAHSVLGPELRAYDLFNGRPREPHADLQTIDWHQDAFNCPRWDENDSRILTFWIPLVPVDEESGCLAVVPGSHGQGVLPSRADEFGITKIDPGAAGDLEGLAGTPVPMQPGDALMFNELVLHRSLPNVSERVRWSVDIRFSADEPAHRDKAPGGFRVRSESLPPESAQEWAAKWDPRTGVMRRQLRMLDLYANSLGPAGRDVRTY